MVVDSLMELFPSHPQLCGGEAGAFPMAAITYCVVVRRFLSRGLGDGPKLWSSWSTQRLGVEGFFFFPWIFQELAAACNAGSLCSRQPGCQIRLGLWIS